MKENYTTPDVKLVGFAPQQDNAAFEFDDLLVRSAGKQEPADLSGYDVPVIIRESY